MRFAVIPSLRAKRHIVHEAGAAYVEVAIARYPELPGAHPCLNAQSVKFQISLSSERENCTDVAVAVDQSF